MINKILSRIEDINNSIDWIKKHKKEQYEQRFISLIEERRKLRILKNTEQNNPGIAAFGQSQVGKSYLMNCILQNSESPFMVDTASKKYNFVDEINPIGEGAEATGVVTRFTSYCRNENDYNLKYPIRMKVLSLKDIINIISDTYFNEFDDYTTLGENDIIEKVEEWKVRYQNAPANPKPVLTADDMLDIKYYFKKHINNAQIYSTRTSLFDKLALFIENVPSDDYVNIFSLLWNREDEYTKLYEKAYNSIKKLQFSEYIYLPIEAVLHRGIKHDTIMSVSCLNLLCTETEKQCVSEVYNIIDGNVVNYGKLSKSELCLICSEVVIKIGKEFISSVGEYSKENISDSSKTKLSKGVVTLDILKTTDLLDFPGARARGNMRLEQIADHNQLMYSILRGKVAYLFNKYNEEKNLNILLFCHHSKNNEAPQMWQLLNDWVNEYVGNTPEKRADYINKIQGSPFFHIGTMFNLNLQYPDNATVGMTDESIFSRWKGRFEDLLLKECFKKTTDNWVSNWTEVGEAFKNCFMLRDYKFSRTIYKGWDEKTGSKESELLIEEDYYKRMRAQFIKFNNESSQIFEDPELAWDVSASQNNDGALYILQQLSKVSKNIEKGRTAQIQEQFKKSTDTLYNIMKEYFISTNKDEILEANISKAYSIFREMDITCNDDNYYFGHLLQALQITETSSYRIIHKKIQSPELNTKVNDFKDYEIIRNSCMQKGYPIESAEDDKAKWDCLINTYKFKSQEEAESFLEHKHIDVRKLFEGTHKRKLNSCIIADSVFDKWCEKIKSVEFLDEFANEDGFDAGAMMSLVENLVATADILHLRDIMAESIAEYVNVVDIHKANEHFLADILASIINDYVSDFGFKYLSTEDVNKAKKLCSQRNIPSFNYIEKELPGIYTERELTEMFDNMSINPHAILPSFEDNYNKWIEYMFISFIAHLDIPDFDHEANRVLSEILKKLETV